MNGNPLEDFGMSGWHYLRRSIVIWSDSVKLRYGDCPADSPFLWEHMSKYVFDMAMTFDGFRLDNAHPQRLIGKDFLQLADEFHHLLVFVLDLLALQTRQALEAHFEDGLGLNF